MSYAFICNTASDNLSKVNLETFQEEQKIRLNFDGNDHAGPHGLCIYEGHLLVANNYSHTLSVIKVGQEDYAEHFFIGMHCNDVAVLKDNAYIVCGDSNIVVAFDLIKKRMIEQIPCGNLPHSIHVNPQKKLLLITNMGSDTITIIDCSDQQTVEHIRVGAYPTKAMFTADGEHILICESNINKSCRGNIGLMSTQNYRLIHKVAVGNTPVDMCYNQDYCFVSNFGDGTISVIDRKVYKEIDKINIGGMPRGILQKDNHIYVGDYYNHSFFQIDLKTGQKKTIPIGKEPTGMTLF